MTNPAVVSRTILCGAMSLALTGLVLPGITILNPGCTAKTYPRFFEDLAALLKA